MDIPTVLVVVALILGAISLIQAKGGDLVAWGVVLIAASLLWGFLT